MYFPVGWPASINLSPSEENFVINHVSCDAVRILIAAISDRILGIWYANPLIPITFHQRTLESLDNYGVNKLIVWKPDSRQILILTTKGSLILYYIAFDPTGNGVLSQKDSPSSSLKRDSAELFIKENVPRLSLHLQRYICFDTPITTLNCISLTEILISTEQSTLLKVLWSDFEESNLDENHFQLNDDEFSINLQKIPIYANHHCHIKSLPAPVDKELIVTCLEYSPFIGGCSLVFRNKRAAFLIAKQLKFESQNIHGYWVPDIDDATICSVNHKFRLLAYGRENSEVSIYGIEDATGGLEFTHSLICHHNSTPEALGAVNEMKWSPDGCVLAVSWSNGGISLWSTFGTLLMCSLNWDFGLHVNLQHFNPIQVLKLEWSTEGYHLFLTCKSHSDKNLDSPKSANVLQMSFVKSTLATNPCMASHSHILLQGDNTLYLNQGDSLETTYFGSDFIFPNNQKSKSFSDESEDNLEVKRSEDFSRVLSESKHWTVLQLPLTYAATNWPIRYSSIDATGLHIAVAGRTGLAHYSVLTKKWKVFGNETQEKDFVVSGGLLWWKDFILMGCYSILDRTDEVRYYPQETKLDNQYGNKISVRAPVITINLFRDQLVILTGDGIVSLFVLNKQSAYNLDVQCVYEVDVKSICIHPACIVSLNVTHLKHEQTAKTQVASTSNVAETIIVNICGRILMVQTETGNNIINSLMASCLASCVECFWITNEKEKGPMSDCLWFYSGAYGMRVWLPISPPLNEPMSDSTHRMHTFMSKRIMLSFPLKLYPLAILFDNVIVVGVENDNTLYTNESKSHFSLPFNLLGRKSQVYLHKILRQLIKRNLGYNAWKIAQSCCALPYFPHSLELLLHEVLEEEATSKRIPDALLPSILAFIREFPIYLQTIVQCARKTEIALWPYLFSMAGKPKDIFQLCVQANELETAASYLIILQNLESSTISKHHATKLLEICLQKRKWKLAKDLNRFLKAIDPNEIDSPRSSMIINMKIAPPTQQSQAQVNQNSEAFNMILGPIARERSYSTTAVTNIAKETKKDKQQSNDANTPSSNANKDTVIRRKSERSISIKEQHKETFGIDEILNSHAQNLLKKCNLIDLGYMSAFLDFHLVKWLSQESEKSARLDDYITALINLHKELHLPEPFGEEGSLEQTSIDYCSQLQQQFFSDSNIHAKHTSSRTSESGYNSMAFMELPYNSLNNNPNDRNIQSIKEGKEMSFANHNNFSKSRLSSPSLDHNDEPYYPLNEQIYRVDLDSTANIKFDSPRNYISEKLTIKLRYLLQLFTEAHCLDFAIILSILLQDGASITRIVNILSRSKSLATVQRIETALKHLTQKCFQCETIHRSFIISIQPYIYALEQITEPSSLSHINSNDEIKNSLSNISSDGKQNSRLHNNISYMSQHSRNSANIMNWNEEEYSNNAHRLSINSNYESTNNCNTQQTDNSAAPNNKCIVM